MQIARSKYLLLIWTLLLCSYSWSQTDSHYWTHQYGAKGLLLNGAVIADPGDETSLYYNPGAIGRGDNLGFAISFLTPNYSTLSTTNLLGDNKTYVDTDFNLSPGFIAVRFRPFKIPDLTFGVTTFERFQSSVRYQDRNVGLSGDTIQDIFRSDLDYRRNVSQTWYGLGFAYNFNESFSLGMTQFFVFHDESFGLDLRRELYGINRPDILTVGSRTDIGYNISFDGAMISKLGSTFQRDNYKIGITYTSSIYGKFKNDASYSIDFLSKDERRQTTVLSNRPGTQLSDFRSPWSLGFGAELNIDKWNFYFSTEYFASVKEYLIIDDLDDPFDGIIPDSEPVPFQISAQNLSVINFALGAQRSFQDGQALLFGFRTDFNESSNFNLNNNLSFVSTNPAVVHVSGGGLFNLRRNKVSVGFDYGIGVRSNGKQIFDNGPITRDNLLEFGTQSNAKNTYHTLTLFLTYDFIFSQIDAVNY